MPPKDTSDSLKVLHEVEPEDLISYGLIPEFVGRLPMIATLDELDENALIKILLEPKNAITKQYSKFLKWKMLKLSLRYFFNGYRKKGNRKKDWR